MVRSRIFLLTAVVGFGVILAFGVSVKNDILEYWWIGELSSESRDDRFAALDRLVELASVRAVSPLLDLANREAPLASRGGLPQRDLDRLLNGLERIAKTRPEKALPVLLQGVSESELPVQIRIVELAKALRPHTRGAVAKLVEILERSVEREKLPLHYAAAEALEAAGAVALPFLKNLSNHPNKDVRLSAAHLRVSIGWSAAPSPAEPRESAITDEGTLVWAFVFGSQQVNCPGFNDPRSNYTVVYHGGGQRTDAQRLAYNARRGWGYERIYGVPENPELPYGDRNGFGSFGPCDDSPNNRGNFSFNCREKIYDSFVGCKNFLSVCSKATVGNGFSPCTTAGLAPEGVIFRADVPNGRYRFVGAFGDADNAAAHRIVVEDGGFGPPGTIGPNHVVLVRNFDQAQETMGESNPSAPGQGVYARVGFGGRIPPWGDGVHPDPKFVDMDERGFPTDDLPNSPTLTVTQGYVRLHQLQGNSNDGPGGTGKGLGGDVVVFESWRVSESQ